MISTAKQTRVRIVAAAEDEVRARTGGVTFKPGRDRIRGYQYECPVAWIDYNGESWGLYFYSDLARPAASGPKTRGWPERAGAALGKALVIGKDK